MAAGVTYMRGVATTSMHKDAVRSHGQMLTVDRGVVEAAVSFQEQLVVEASDHLLLCGLDALQLHTDLREEQADCRCLRCKEYLTWHATCARWKRGGGTLWRENKSSA